MLNLTADPTRYGKEIGGDLWEGKHTIPLLHCLRSMSPAERRRAVGTLRKARPGHAQRHSGRVKTAAEVARLRAAIDRTGSLDHARTIALTWTVRARRQLARAMTDLPSSVHADLLANLVAFVVERDH